MRPERLYLNDIVEAAGELADFLDGRCREDLESDRMLQAAVLQKLTVIGEAAGRVGPNTRARHPEVPWSDIVAFRNLTVHAYFSLDLKIVWVTAVRSVPVLRHQVEAIIRQEYPEESCLDP